MSYAELGYPGSYGFAAQADADARASFLAKTYFHLAGAVAAFVAIEAALLQTPGIERLIGVMVTGYNWLIVLGAFMVVSYVADRWACSAVSPGMQYLGLSLYVVVEAVIFLPLLYFASHFGGESVIPTAGALTLIVFTGLSLIVFVTRKDFSFLRSYLMFGMLAAFGLILCAVLFGFTLGVFFTAGMIALAGGYVLYTTSNVLHHYRIGQHVAAALALFAAVALLFWYILQLVMSLSRD